MAQFRTSTKFANWKRLLISGLVSALIAGISFSLVLYGGGRMLRDISLILFFMALGFGLPAFVTPHLNNIMNVMLVILVWFLVGTTVAYFGKRNVMAVGLWLVVYAISSLITLYLFAQSLY